MQPQSGIRGVSVSSPSMQRGQKIIKIMEFMGKEVKSIYDMYTILCKKNNQLVRVDKMGKSLGSSLNEIINQKAKY